MSQNTTIIADETTDRQQARATRLPSDALRRTRHPVRFAVLALSAFVAVVVLSVGASLVGVALHQHPATAKTVSLNVIGSDAAPIAPLSPDSVEGSQAVDAAQAAALAAQQQAAAEAAAAAAAQQAAAQKAAAEQHHAASGPTKCPSGTTAGAVDGAGNESNCQPLNGAGQSCQAYNDANVCIAWASLSESPLRP